MHNVVLIVSIQNRTKNRTARKYKNGILWQSDGNHIMITKNKCLFVSSCRNGQSVTFLCLFFNTFYMMGGYVYISDQNAKG